MATVVRCACIIVLQINWVHVCVYPFTENTTQAASWWYKVSHAAFYDTL
jgi:hypothetical protein